MDTTSSAENPSAILLIELLARLLVTGSGTRVICNAELFPPKYVQLLGSTNKATSLTSSANTYHDWWVLVYLEQHLTRQVAEVDA